MTEDSQPEAPDLRQRSRRDFLKAAAVTLLSILIALVLVPMGWMLSVVGYRRRGLTYTRVASVASLPTGQPQDVSFTAESAEAYLRERVTYDAWVIKHSPTEVTVYSPICPHLGCRYDWHPQRGEFICPCHNSVFSTDGKVLAGPAPRPLDTLPHKIEGGELLVAWERFQPGIAKKVPI
jgi:menaquinol-cytochrome c reductase iron-sulfur subunit